MLDKQLLLLEPKSVQESICKRFGDPSVVDKLISIHGLWKSERHKLEDFNRELRTRSKEIRDVKRDGGDTTELVAQVKALKKQQGQSKTHTEELWNNFELGLKRIGNIVHDTVPVSNDEKDNVLVSIFTVHPQIYEDGVWHHHQLLYMIDGYSPESGTKVVGHRGYYLRGPGALLNMALMNYGMQFLTKREYIPIQPPYFMRQSVMGKVAQLSQYDEELYHVSTQSANEDQYLIATSEQPLAAYHMDQQLNAKELPIRYAGYSTCVRKEAGENGKDTWGIFLVHQFDKIEHFCITTAEKSWEEHEQMLETSEAFLQSLDIPYRVVNIVSGELNDAAAKKYDIEAWFPAFKEYREVVSCSNCTDYQSRRVNTKLDDGKYPHMLNSTLCASTRVMCAILENNQTASGITVPAVLRNYLGGMEEIPFVNKPRADWKQVHQDS